ncbi:MAG: DUF503 domain-containing protein [Deltaproteobacteria bacterium]|nr:DUF503 domain-containing protein [Deltaproteobacteria bacterium]
MVVGFGTIELRLHGVYSLKEKRSVVRSVVQRVQNQFHISVAEVGALDEHERAVVGFAVVTNDGRLANSILDKVVDAVEDFGLAEVGSVEIDVMHT